MPIKIDYTTGYAGTGKSHSLIERVNSLPLDTIIVIAPTHKALARLRGHLPDNLEIKTIHSLLGWIPCINEEAKRVEHIDSTRKLDKELDEYSHIIIDEAGMMSEEMFFEIIGKLETQLMTTDPEDKKNVYIHCYLDPYQLLPVKGRQIQTDPDDTIHLTTQHRSESLDIVALYTKFVHYLEGLNRDDLTTPYSENVKKLSIKDFKLGDRLLAYTNQAVGNWNQKIANQLGITSYEGQEVQLGNMLDTIIVTKFLEPSGTDLLRWFYTDNLVLQNTNISMAFLESSLQALVDNEHIQFIEGMNNKVYPVIIGIGKANIILKEAKKNAVEDRRKFKEVYALGRAFVMDYTFATTVHKSQGSEFNTVFIDKGNMQKSIVNNYYETYARLMYVALSRAKQKIYI
jgi:ATP-dependent exoDNAse (exonuclease V) alpha subunit